MKFAICNETFQDWPFPKAFSYARELGYTGIEFAPFTMHDDARQISSGQRREVSQQARDADLDVVGLHWLLAKTEGFYLTSPDIDIQNATSEYFCELARLCRDLGGSIMVLGSPQQRNLLPGVSMEQATDHAVKVIEAALPVFEEQGVVLALEPLGPQEGDFWNEAKDAIRVIERLESPNVRLHLDVKAMSTEPSSIPDIISNSQQHLAHFHANDPNRQGPGMGEVKFDAIFAALNEINYDAWVSVEVFDYSPGIERLASESMSNMLAALG